MKKLTTSLAAMALTFTAASALAATQSIPTILTCQQDDGDQWVEVGIAEENGLLNAYVVMNNTDDGSSKLLAKISSIREITRGNATAYLDVKNDFALIVRRESDQSKAKIMYVDDKGPDSVSRDGLLCYKSTHIIFDSAK